jgi:hypothetical protein
MIRDETVLAYSPMIDIKNSSAPFCPHFGALLSVVKSFPAKPTVFPGNLVLDTFPEEEEEEDPADPSSDGDHGDSSSTYKPPGGGGGSSDLPMTHSHRAEGGNADNSMMVCFPAPVGCSKLTGLSAV